MCIYPNCKTIPIYNVEGETKALYCSIHKLDGMVDVKNKSCIHPNCKTIPIYNVEGETKALYCSIHKLDGMVDVIQIVKFNLLIILKEKQKDYIALPIN